MELLYLFDDKRKTNIQFGGSNFHTMRGLFCAVISQVSTHNSYVSGWLFFDYI